MRKIIAIMLIFLGIIILIYPIGADLYAKYQQQRLINSYIENRTEGSFPDILLEDFSESIIEGNREKEIGNKIPNTIGLINIPKININQLPILYDATVANLERTAAMIRGTSFPWEGGNTVIAGHRARANWLHFRRLNEVMPGDEVILEIAGRTFVYEIYESFLVLPHEVHVLENIPGETTLTLITCDPPTRNAPYRLIVRGRLQNP